jgi:hypothetical protein
MREVFEAATDGVVIAVETMKDGLTSSDILPLLTKLPGLSMKVIAAAKDIDNVRIADLDTPEERAEAVQFIKNRLNIPDNPKAEEIAEKFASAIISMVGSGVEAAEVYRLFKQVE